ncbi:MAG: hypothetical protein LBR31_07450 [Desulfovibrio sp.]|jgi:ADP-heptose:LPS heptosyltransferase|nr:hypothetical protein [Desulfovibrio sp.]
MGDNGLRGERGNLSLRRVDRLLGVPLVQGLGLLRRLRRRPKPVAAFCPECVAVLCLGAIGDTLLATALLNALARAYPDAEIHVCASAGNAAALPLLDPRIAAAAFPIRDIAAFIRHLRGLKADVLVDTTQWARVGALVSLFSGARLTVGFDTPGQCRARAYDLTVPHSADRHETENFLALARALGRDADAVPSLYIPDAPPPGLVLERFPRLENTVYLHMFASGVSARLKEWPDERWAAVALACCAAGYLVRFTGGLSDAPRAERFLREHIPAELVRGGAVRSLAGKVSLPELAWLMRRGAGAVSVNTGILHLGALSGIPIVDLHGPTRPARWGGVGANVVHLVAPGEGTAYLNLGFENPPDAVPTLGRLSAESVLRALRDLGLTALS